MRRRIVLIVSRIVLAVTAAVVSLNVTVARLLLRNRPRIERFTFAIARLKHENDLMEVPGESPNWTYRACATQL